MDMQQDGWFMQIKLSGITAPLDFRGSVKQLLQEMLVTLRTESPRKVGDAKTITITLSSAPVSTGELSIVDELDSYLRAIEPDVPISDPEPADDLHKAWISDSQAQELRRVLASREAYDSLTPTEFASLAQSVQTRFPARFWQSLRWPKAI